MCNYPYFFKMFDERMLINENLFPKSIKNTPKKNQTGKQNKKQIHNYYCQLSLTKLSPLSFPLPTLSLSPFHLYKISINMLQKPKRKKKNENMLPFSRFQLNIEKKIIFVRKNNFHLNILRVYLKSIYFTKTENFLLKVLQIKLKVS